MDSISEIGIYVVVVEVYCSFKVYQMSNVVEQSQIGRYFLCCVVNVVSPR